ncbi:MAG: hypothetical protein ACRD2U_03925 [Terriglobales bacterium]
MTLAIELQHAFCDPAYWRNLRSVNVDGVGDAGVVRRQHLDGEWNDRGRRHSRLHRHYYVFVATLIFLALGVWLSGQLRFLASWRSLILHDYARAIVTYCSLLFANILGLTIWIERKFFLRDTGRKLKHHDKQAGRYAVPPALAWSPVICSMRNIEDPGLFRDAADRESDNRKSQDFTNEALFRSILYGRQGNYVPLSIDSRVCRRN